jgi:hypothetical protein
LFFNHKWCGVLFILFFYKPFSIIIINPKNGIVPFLIINDC